MASFVEGDFHVSQAEMSLYEEEMSKIDLTSDGEDSESLEVNPVSTAENSASQSHVSTGMLAEGADSKTPEESEDLSEDSGNAES